MNKLWKNISFIGKKKCSFNFTISIHGLDNVPADRILVACRCIRGNRKHDTKVAMSGSRKVRWKNEHFRFTGTLYEMKSTKGVEYSRKEVLFKISSGGSKNGGERSSLMLHGKLDLSKYTSKTKELFVVQLPLKKRKGTKYKTNEAAVVLKLSIQSCQATEESGGSDSEWSNLSGGISGLSEMDNSHDGESTPHGAQRRTIDEKKILPKKRTKTTTTSSTLAPVKEAFSVTEATAKDKSSDKAAVPAGKTAELAPKTTTISTTVESKHIGIVDMDGNNDADEANDDMAGNCIEEENLSHKHRSKNQKKKNCLATTAAHDDAADEKSGRYPHREDGSKQNQPPPSQQQQFSVIIDPAVDDDGDEVDASTTHNFDTNNIIRSNRAISIPIHDDKAAHQIFREKPPRLVTTCKGGGGDASDVGASNSIRSRPVLHIRRCNTDNSSVELTEHDHQDTTAAADKDDEQSSTSRAGEEEELSPKGRLGDYMQRNRMEYGSRLATPDAKTARMEKRYINTPSNSSNINYAPSQDQDRSPTSATSDATQPSETPDKRARESGGTSYFKNLFGGSRRSSSTQVNDSKHALDNIFRDMGVGEEEEEEEEEETTREVIASRPSTAYGSAEKKSSPDMVIRAGGLRSAPVQMWAPGEDGGSGGGGGEGRRQFQSTTTKRAFVWDDKEGLSPETNNATSHNIELLQELDNAARRRTATTLRFAASFHCEEDLHSETENAAAADHDASTTTAFRMSSSSIGLAMQHEEEEEGKQQEEEGEEEAQKPEAAIVDDNNDDRNIRNSSRCKESGGSNRMIVGGDKSVVGRDDPDSQSRKDDVLKKVKRLCDAVVLPALVQARGGEEEKYKLTKEWFWNTIPIMPCVLIRCLYDWRTFTSSRRWVVELVVKTITHSVLGTGEGGGGGGQQEEEEEQAQRRDIYQDIGAIVNISMLIHLLQNHAKRIKGLGEQEEEEDTKIGGSTSSRSEEVEVAGQAAQDLRVVAEGVFKGIISSFTSMMPKITCKIIDLGDTSLECPVVDVYLTKCEVILDMLHSQYCCPSLQSQILRRLFRSLTSQIVNSLLLEEENHVLCTPSGGFGLKVILSTIDAWCSENAPKSSLFEDARQELHSLRDICNVLLLGKAVSSVPILGLNMLQLETLVKFYGSNTDKDRIDENDLKKIRLNRKSTLALRSGSQSLYMNPEVTAPLIFDIKMGRFALSTVPVPEHILCKEEFSFLKRPTAINDSHQLVL